jgi:hypothetical protein
MKDCPLIVVSCSYGVFNFKERLLLGLRVVDLDSLLGSGANPGPF